MNEPFLVAIGASAGGLAALYEFFDHTVPDGVSYVITMHLHPHQKSMLAELIQKHSLIRVHEVENHTPICPNIIYVMPENQVMSIAGGCLMLTPRDLSVRVNRAIDLFFGSLSEDRNYQKIGVILSGSGDDGTRGIRELAANGAFIIAQEPSTAAEGNMPLSAILSGSVHRVLLTADMPQVIIDYIAQHRA